MCKQKNLLEIQVGFRYNKEYRVVLSKKDDRAGLKGVKMPFAPNIIVCVSSFGER